MKQLDSSAEAATALRFLESVVDARSALGERLMAFARDGRHATLASRPFRSEEELGWGLGEGHFSDALIEIASRESGRPRGTLMLWDNGFGEEDVPTGDPAMRVAGRLPDLVYPVEEIDGALDLRSLEAALRACVSFYPVAFFASGDAGSGGDITAVLVSAFDQEGALAWL